MKILYFDCFQNQRDMTLEPRWIWGRLVPLKELSKLGLDNEFDIGKKGTKNGITGLMSMAPSA